MSDKYVGWNKRAAVFAVGCLIMAVGFGLEFLLTLEISFMGMPGVAAFVLGCFASGPLGNTLYGNRKASTIFAFLFPLAVAALYFFGDAIGYTMLALDPSAKKFIPLIHGYDFYWYFYLTGAALTVFGAFMPHPVNAEAG
jgi:hypothetical protein